MVKTQMLIQVLKIHTHTPPPAPVPIANCTTLNMLVSKPSQTCFCALGKQIVTAGVNDINGPVIQGGKGGALPTFCLFKISGLCLNRKFWSKVCFKAHLDKLSESSEILPVSFFHMSTTDFIPSHFFSLECQNSGFL